ncbi:MAG: hypothetical protein ACR2KK_13080 [Acidimicrobiales bacterium]
MTVPAGIGDGEATAFFRRQLVLVAVAGGVVLVAVIVVGAVMAGGHDAAHAALRPSADGSGVTAVSPLAESSRTAVWAAVAALLAVAAVLTVAVVHVCRVARFAVSTRTGGGSFPHDAASPDVAQEAC